MMTRSKSAFVICQNMHFCVLCIDWDQREHVSAFGCFSSCLLMLACCCVVSACVDLRLPLFLLVFLLFCLYVRLSLVACVFVLLVLACFWLCFFFFCFLCVCFFVCLDALFLRYFRGITASDFACSHACFRKCFGFARAFQNL